ncbi:hypothetical protein BJX96DRAFT_170704 [Aspergillus floccosus]
MKLYLLFCLVAIVVAAATAVDDLSSDLAVNVTELNDIIAAIKADVLNLPETTADDVTVNPRAILADRAGPCNHHCKGPGAKPCCPKDTCFMDVCIGPHLGPREFPEAFSEYAKRELADIEVADVDLMDSDSDDVSLEKRDPKCRRRCTSHTQCCRTDLCIKGACLGRHEDHP